MRISFTFGADPREMQGKGASRRLRHTGKVPAILYGGHKDAQALVLDQQNLLTMISDERFYSSIVQVKITNGMQQEAIVKDVQMHPAKKDLPEFLELDMSGMSLNETKFLSDIPLPPGVAIPELAHRNAPVVSIHSPRAEEPEPVAEVAVAAPVEGAPAAGAAAAAPAAADAKKGDAKAEAAPAKKEGGKK
jgi:large subunit ribosomal protein L25